MAQKNELSEIMRQVGAPRSASALDPQSGMSCPAQAGHPVARDGCGQGRVVPLFLIRRLLDRPLSRTMTAEASQFALRVRLALRVDDLLELPEDAHAGQHLRQA